MPRLECFMFLSALLFAGRVAAVQLDSTLSYTVTLAGGKVSGCSPLLNMLNNHGCNDGANVQDLANVDDNSGNQHYRFVPVPGLTDTFNIITSCQKYISCSELCGDRTVNLWGVDDGSGRQRWRMTAVDTNTYTFQVVGGRDASCSSYLSTGDQCSDTFVNLWLGDDGSGRQRWVLNAVQASSGSSSSSVASSSSSSSVTSSVPNSSSGGLSLSPSNSFSTSSSGSSGTSVSILPSHTSSSSTLSSGASSSSTSSSSGSPSSSSSSSSSSNSSSPNPFPPDSESSSPNSSSETTPSSSKTNVGAIAGGSVGGILLVLLLAGILLFVYIRRKRDDPPNAIPYMPAEATEPGAESFGLVPPETMPGTLDSTPWQSTEKGRRLAAGGVTRVATGEGILRTQHGWDSDESSGRMSVVTTSHPGSPSEAAEAADLRNEVDNLRREMAELRAQREYETQMPPLYEQI